jgi:rhamnulokinase
MKKKCKPLKTMAKDYKCIAIDMGASAIRVLLGTISENEICYQEVYRFKNEIKHIDGHDRWDIFEIQQGIIYAINKVLETEKNNIKSFGVDSWGVDFVLIGSDGRLIELPVAYRDSRTYGMDIKWATLMSREETFRRTGINFYIFNTLFQLLSVRNEPVMQKVSRILFMPNYIYYYLTGVAFNEISIASTSQLLRVDAVDWDEEILKHCNINPDILNPILEAGKITGEINNMQINHKGISAISVCSHDTASAVAAIPAEKSGFVFISTGTWCIAGMESDIPLLSDDALKKGFTNERGINNTYRVLKNIPGLWFVQGIQKALKKDITFDEMENWAMNNEFSGWLINPEDDVFYNPADMIKAFDQFFTKTGQNIPSHPGYYVKCAYDSLCLSFKQCIEEIEFLSGKSVEIIHIIGGGCKSVYLCQATADFCGKVVIAGPVEGAGIGNIMVQGIAAGVIKDLTDGRRMVKNSFDIKEYKPQYRGVETLYSKYRSLKNA